MPSDIGVSNLGVSGLWHGGKGDSPLRLKVLWCPPHHPRLPGPVLPTSLQRGPLFLWELQGCWRLGNTRDLRRGQGSGLAHTLTLLRRWGGNWCKPLKYCPFLLFFELSLVLPPQILEPLLGDSDGKNTIFRTKFKILQNSPQGQPKPRA